MPFDELLQRLVHVTPGQKSYLSLYLDLSPDRSGKKLHSVFLKSRLTELSGFLPAHSPEKSYLAKDIKRVQKYLEEELDPSWKGIAIFACAAEDVFIPIPMPLPPENALDLAPYPHLFSLLRHTDLYKTHSVVVADSRQARLFLVHLARLEKQLTLSWEDKHTTRFGRMGLSSQRFQRHIQEHIKQRGKEIIENLGKMINSGKTENLFLVAEKGMEAEIKKQLSATWKRKLVSLPSLDPHDPDHKILSAASEALRSLSRQRAEALAKHILDEAVPLGQATSGSEPTLSALQNHQVERMVFDVKFDAAGWRCPECYSLGWGGLPSACPFCNKGISPANLREEIVAKAKSQGIELFFTENFLPLKRAGGVAALLKYKTAKRTKG